MKIINLLPPAEQEIVKEKKILFIIKRCLIFSGCSYALVLVLIVGARLLEQNNLSSLKSQIEQAKSTISKQDNAALKQQIELNNSLIGDYNNLAAQNPQWAKVLLEFAKLLPADIALQSFDGSTQEKRIQISGKSKTRDAVLLLRSNIIKSSYFKNIDLPFENLQKPTNVDFHYTFYVTDAALGNTNKAPLPKRIVTPPAQ